MKYLSLCLLLLVACRNSPSPAAQKTFGADSSILRKQPANPYSTVDVSPMDMIYFPTDFPIKKMDGDTAQQPVMRIIYSRPHRQGRTVFGNLLQWGQPWRLGANEATELQLFKAINIQGTLINKGQYLMYAVPYPDHWTLVLNNNLYAWGLKFNPLHDVYKFNIPATGGHPLMEYFTMAFEKMPSGASLIMAWENVEARLPIQF